MNARLTGLGLNLLSFAVGIGGWYLLTATGAVVLPGPVDVLERAVTLLLNGQLVGDIFASLRRVLSGFVLGVALAIPVGFLMGWYRIARSLIEPWVQFFRMIPPLAVIPLAIVTLGIDDRRRFSLSFLHRFCLLSWQPIRA